MKGYLNELVISEQRRSDEKYISRIIQNERYKPKKYKHYISMPKDLFYEIKERRIISVEDYIIDESAFFEFFSETVTISFISLYSCEDLHRKIDHYLVVKYSGDYPLKRGGIFF
jgi:hypothetical protein